MTTAESATHDQKRLQSGAATVPPIAADVLYARCLGNASFALSLLDELGATGTGQVDGIILKIINHEPQAAAEAAHSLKGAAAIIGAEPVREIAGEIETAGLTSDTSRLLMMAGELRRAMDRCLAYLPEVRAEIQQRSSTSL